jgi:hypothetical protein
MKEPFSNQIKLESMRLEALSDFEFHHSIGNAPPKSIFKKPLEAR